MRQYLDALCRAVTEGTRQYIDRNRTWCYAIPPVVFTHDCSDGYIPLLTTKRVAYRVAFAEALAYWRGYSNLSDFHDLGTRTWDENAKAEGWVKSPFYKGDGDLGRIYGVQGRRWRKYGELLGRNGKVCAEYLGPVDQLRKVYDNLRRGIDDRGEIITYWNVGELDRGCLRPCMFQHQFTLLDNTLHLTSYQRSGDLPLGVPFNMAQTGWLLHVMARITGSNPGTITHIIANPHVYEDQIPAAKKQLMRFPRDQRPKLNIPNNINTLQDMDSWVRPTDFVVDGYDPASPLNYPFSA